VIARKHEQTIADALADTPVVLLVGPRQCGKSTLADQFQTSGRRRVTLDDPDAFSLAKTDPKGFLKTFTGPLIIDEVQRAPELFLALKQEVDRARQPGMYLLTGSANILAFPKVADSLAGRMEVIDLLPFSRCETDNTDADIVDRLFAVDWNPPAYRPGLESDIVRGGFPEPRLRISPSRRTGWFQSYVRTLLDRDVRDLAQIEGLAHLPRLLTMLAMKVGQPLNASTLAVETGIAYTSLKRYLTLLEKVFLLDLVPAWSFEMEKALTKSPKAFLVDTGLLCHLQNLDERTLDDPIRSLPLLRNHVALELRKQIGWSTTRPWLLHLRTVRHLEVDFVLEAPGGDIVGIALKSGPSAGLADIEGLRYLQELAGPRFRRGVVLHRGEEWSPLAPDIWSGPVSSM
jgi:predicted AAA+ superfamily ATPase